MITKGIEVLDKIKQLKNTSSAAEIKLERDGLSITNMAKEQLFNHNIKNIISAIEGLLRNEPSERHVMRLEKEIPDCYSNITKIKETAPGKLSTTHLDTIKELIGFLNQNYPKL